MALRVLLADESTTIKKVMQLALQDFAVEVKAVHAGVDVLDVARTFSPDIIFADVLLQKKNGYEVCALLKADAELKSVPVVLMWSSFMDLDDAQAKASGAEARLEKPFDVETLRKQVLELVPKTRSQRLAHFLEYSPTLNENLKGDAKKSSGNAEPTRAQAPSTAPAQPTPTQAATRVPAAPPPREEAPKPQAAAPRPAAPPPPAAPAAYVKMREQEAPKVHDFGSFDEPSAFAEEVAAGAAAAAATLGSDDDEDFKPLELSKLGRASDDDVTPDFGQTTDFGTDLSLEGSLEVESEDAVSADDENWSRQDLSKFKLDLQPITVGEDENERFNVDLGDREFSRPNITAPNFAPDLALDVEQIASATDEVALPLEPIDTDDARFETEPTFETTRDPVVPQLSADRLEAIIRAQSREIIEQVVRKMVPDLASEIIREELERLLEDTAIRDSRL